MLERPGDIIKGAIIMAKALRVERIIIGIEDNKLDGIIAMRDVARVVIARDDEAISEQGDCFASLRSARNDVFRVVSLPTKYPQGAEKQLIKTLTGKEVPSGGLPFDVGVVVHNVATAQAVYEAVVLNKPFFERVITVSGDCVKDPGNLLVKIGTPVKDLINDCGGFVKEPLKVIFGGPMMGFAQWALDVPVLEGTSGVLFLSIDAISQDPAGVCIRCGGCVRLCPMGLSPTSIYYAAVNNKFDLANEYNALDCVECGACSWECPAKLDLVGMIKYAKLRIRK
jgi:electron transport complex protein RnfC